MCTVTYILHTQRLCYENHGSSSIMVIKIELMIFEADSFDVHFFARECNRLILSVRMCTIMAPFASLRLVGSYMYMKYSVSDENARKFRVDFYVFHRNVKCFKGISYLYFYFNKNY